MHFRLSYLFLLLSAALLWSCTKQQGADPVKPEQGGVKYVLEALDFSLKNAGSKNAGVQTPASFDGLLDIHSLLFSTNGRLTALHDITSYIDWDGKTGRWIDGPVLPVPTGKQQSLVVVNAYGMYDINSPLKGGVVALGARLDDLRFHLAPGDAYSGGVILNNDIDRIYEMAASVEPSAFIDIPHCKTAADAQLFSSSFTHVNSLLRVNMAYNQETMFPGTAVEKARFRVKEVTVSGIPESVDYKGAKPSGSLAVSRTDMAKNLNHDKTGSELVGVKDNVFTTLLFPSEKLAVDIVLEYTTDGGNTWIQVPLETYIINNLQRNLIADLNVWLKGHDGSVIFSIRFIDWTVENQYVYGDEE